LASAEQKLKGRTLGTSAVKNAVVEALADIVALSDLHASSEYRRRVAANLAVRAVDDARSRASGKKIHAH
jgi:carbon-monoxide dehydrogenase medium subunit